MGTSTKKVKFIFPDKVKGWLSYNEGKVLYELAQKQPKSGCVVELGTYQGRSAICLAQGSLKAGGGPIFTIDKFTGDRCIGQKQDYYYLFLKNIKRFGTEKEITGIRGDTVEVGRGWKKSTRLLFLDATHFYQDVVSDWKAWERHLVNGGIVVFHDCNWPGVYRLIGQLVKAGKIKYPRVLLGNGSTGLTWAYKVSPKEKISRLTRYWALLNFKYLFLPKLWGRFEQTIKERGERSETDIWFRFFGSLANFWKRSSGKT